MNRYTSAWRQIDGIIDLRVVERDGDVKNLFRVRAMKGRMCDSRWHEIKIGPDGEAALVS